MVQTAEQLVSTDAERYLLIYMIAVLAIVTGLVILFFIVFQKRKNKLLIEKMKLQQKFEEEFTRSQIEIQEETLKHIGLELHDNIGQLLSVANMNLNLLETKVAEDLKPQFSGTNDVIKQSLDEVRSLSKTLNSDVIQNHGFKESLLTEIKRLNKMRLLKAELKSFGDSGVCRNNKDAVILFRVLQEFISNTIKYSQASELEITLNYSETNLAIVARDNGVGFDLDTVQYGSGLINMEGRCKLIDTEYQLESSSDTGTKITLNYPIKLRALS